MIVWVAGGFFVGWFLSARLGAQSLGVFLISSVVMPLAVFAAVRRFDPEALLGHAAFWVAVQGSYFFANLAREWSAPRGRDGGADASAFERA